MFVRSFRLLPESSCTQGAIVGEQTECVTTCKSPTSHLQTLDLPYQRPAEEELRPESQGLDPILEIGC